MIITSKLIVEQPYGWPISSSSGSIVLTCLLHRNKIISRDKMLGMFKSIKAGGYTREFKTFHFEPLNIWYHEKWTRNSKYLAMVRDPIISKAITTGIPLSEFIPYIKLYLNVNTNYAIDWIWFEIIKPIIKCNLEYVKLLQVEGLNFLTYEEADWYYDLASGYCCYGCDGDKGEYKRGRYESNYRLSEKEVVGKIIGVLNSYKTHQKNPLNRLDEYLKRY